MKVPGVRLDEWPACPSTQTLDPKPTWGNYHPSLPRLNPDKPHRAVCDPGSGTLGPPGQGNLAKASCGHQFAPMWPSPGVQGKPHQVHTLTCHILPPPQLGPRSGLGDSILLGKGELQDLGGGWGRSSWKGAGPEG